MIRIGEYNTLIGFRQEPQGIYLLDKEDREEVLLPNNYIPENFEMGDPIEVFVYKDSEDREVATTETPFLKINEIAALKVIDINNAGAFMSWGILKDLLLPYGEQTRELKVGKKYVVFLTLDYKSERLIASMKVDRVLDNSELDVVEGQEVDIMPFTESDLGFNVVVNKKYKGLIFRNDLFQRIEFGETIKGYIKTIREDNKLDISLQKQGFQVFEDHTQTVLSYLESCKGFSPLNDKSSPEAISAELKMSKKAFKKAIGILYKAKKLEIKDDGIHLI